eukprot:88107-Rhodomonas_salina.2
MTRPTISAHTLHQRCVLFFTSSRGPPPLPPPHLPLVGHFSLLPRLLLPSHPAPHSRVRASHVRY